jgi:transcriptional regulator with XRE-family HTH domain
MSVIKQILTEKGWSFDKLNRLKPSEETLAKLGINTMTQWNKIIEGESELTLSQAQALSKWLDIPFERLLQKEHSS